MNFEKILSNKNSEQGFSLVQIMVSTVIMGFLGSGIASMLVHNTKASIYLDDKASRRDLKAELERLFLDPVACENTLANTLIPPNINDQVNLGTIALKNTTNQTIFSDFKYDQLNMNQFRLVNDNIAPTNFRGYTKLFADINRDRGGAQAMQPISILLKTEVDPTTRRIVSCKAKLEGGSGLSEGACVANVYTSGRPTGALGAPASYNKIYVTEFYNVPEILEDGESLKSIALTAGDAGCDNWTPYNVYETTLECNNKVIIEKTRKLLFTATSSFTMSNRSYVGMPNDRDCGRSDY